LGGLSKKAFQLAAIAGEDEAKPHFALDAGNLLFKQGGLVPGREGQGKLTATAIVKAYNAMGYDAVAVGGLDLQAGVPFLQSLAKEAKFAWLSANLVSQSTKKAIMRPGVTLQARGIKVWVVGLTGAAILPANEDAMILPWDQVLPGLLDKEAKTHDLVVLLSSLPAPDNQRIAETYRNIHLVIQAGVAANVISAQPINNTVLASAGPQGKQLGVLEIDWQPSKRWASQARENLASTREALAQVQFQLSAIRQDPDPETALRNRPEQLNAYHLLQKRETALVADVERLSKEVAEEDRGRDRPSTYRNRFVAMEATLPDQPQVLSLITRLKEEVNAMGQQQGVASPPAPGRQIYLGSAGCGSCHQSQHAAWQATPHASAYQALAKDRQQFNPECLPCHVTGIAMDQGKEALSLPEDRRGVGCESCHGPVRDHRERRQGKDMIRKPSPEMCLTCHVPPHDLDFEYGAAIKKVGH